MWTQIVFLVILATAASAEHGFKVGTEYKYEVTSKTLTSLQQVSQQYSGVFIRAQLTVKAVKEDELFAQISQPEKAQIHIPLPEGVEFDVPSNVMNYSPFTFSNEPFVIRLKDGIVTELVVSKDVQIWEVNIIRSIVSQLQIDTQGKRVIPSKLNSIPTGDENTAVYKVMEDSVEGECEVLYDITPLPKYVLQRTPQLAPLFHTTPQGELIDIMKTKNFSNCEQRPGSHFGFNGLTNWEPTTNKMGNFLSRSSVSRVIVSGSLKNYTIQSSVTTNKVILSPEVYNNQKGEVVSRVNLTLVSVRPTSGEIQGLKNPQTLKKLVYEFNNSYVSNTQTRDMWNDRQEKNILRIIGAPEGNSLLEQLQPKKVIDVRTMIHFNERRYQETPTMTQAPESPFLPYFVGYEGHSIQTSKDININQVVRKTAEQIGQFLQDSTQLSKEKVLERFTVLTRIIRTMNAKQLEQAVQEIYSPEKENTQGVSDTPRNTWMTFRDALAQAGTGPALTTIVSLITSQKIKGEEAAQIVSTLPETARYPTTEYINTFFELMKKPEVTSQAGLNSSCIYSFTNLVRLTVVDQKTFQNRYPVYAFGYLTDKGKSSVTETYIPYFAQRLDEAVKEEDSHKIQTYIRALGNIAHPKIVQIFEPYLEGKKPMTDFQRTLVIVSLNKLAIVHPRLARSVLYKTYANTGEAYQVRVAAVYNLMKTNPSGSMLQRMAQFTHEDPSNQVRSAVKSAIESAALLTTKSNQELRQNAQSAVNMVVPKVFGLQYSRENLTDYLIKGLHLGYTQHLEYIGSEDSLIPKLASFKVIKNLNGFKNSFLKMTGMISSVQNLHQLLQDIFVFDEQEHIMGTPESKVQTFTLEKIRKILNIEQVLKEQVEGNFAFKFGTMERFFAFDNHTIELLPQIINKFSQLLARGKAYNYQKIFNDYQITVGLPTATGLPFVYTMNTPIYVGLKGKVQAEVPEIQTTQRGSQIPKTAKFTSNVEVTYATTKIGEIGFVTPFDHQRYVAGYKRQIQVNVPVKGSVAVDVEKRHIQVEIKPAEKRGDYEFVHYNTKPYTAIQSVLEFKPITEGSNTKIIEPNVLREVKQYYGEKIFGVVVRLQGRTENRNLPFKKTVYTMVQRHNLLSALLYPTSEDMVGNTEISLSYDSQKSTAQTISVTATYRKIRSKNYREHEEETTKVFVPTKDSQTRIEEFYNLVSAGIKKATVHVLDLGLKVQGQTPTHYVGTVAYARSPIDAPTKVLAYFHKTYGNENYEICFNGNMKDSYLSAVDFEKVIKAEPHSVVSAQLKFGEKCESGAKVDLSGKLERSPERREYLLTLPQVQICKSEMQQGDNLLAGCRNATYQAGLMDKYRFTVKYHQVPETIKNMTYQVYSVLRHVGYPYVTESINTQGGNSHGKEIELDVNFSPDLNTANIYVSAPTGVAQFRNIHVNRYVRNVFVLHPVYNVIQRIGWSYLKQQHKAYCTIDKVHAKTFDNQTYSTHLGNVWHVMSISVPKVSPDRKFGNVFDFSVLVREDSSNHKEVQFTFDYPQSTILRVAPSQGQTPAKVFVNEKAVTFDDKGYYEYHNGQQTVIQAYVLPTGEIKIVHPEHGFEFIYDTTRVQLVLSQEYRNRVGGLCGVYNGENFDYVTPQGYILQNPKEFAATWALSGEGQITEYKKRAQEHSQYKKVVILTNSVGRQDVGKADSYGRYYESGLSQDYDTSVPGSEESQGNNNQCTTKRIMVIEREGKHCFSVQPQTACRSECQVEKTTTKNADFICVNKTQTSSHWAQMVARGAQPNFKNKGNSQKMQFEGPEICTEA